MKKIIILVLVGMTLNEISVQSQIESPKQPNLINHTYTKT